MKRTCNTTVFAAFVALCLAGCANCGGGGGGVPDAAVSGRCEIDLAASGYFSQAGSGASAAVITDSAQLIGGEGATGRLGDFLLQNDKVRVIVEQPGRTVGPLLSGGGIIDADLQHAGPGRDAFGRMALFYAFGRISSVKSVEVLSDGSNGGPAVVAATGVDVQHDLLNVNSLIASVSGLDIQFIVDPNKPLPVKSTTYYVLSPGESRVRMLTAFCNEGSSPVLMPLIELMDVGAFEIFNSGPCTNSLGTSKLDPNNDCTAMPSKWFGTQGDGVAYAVRSMSLTDLNTPVQANAVIGYGGVVGAFIEGESLTGLLSWTNPDARTRPGTFNIRAGQSRSYLRDFVISKDLASVNGEFEALDGKAMGSLEVTATLPGGAPAPYARIALLDSTGTMKGVLAADAQGKATTRIAAGSYSVSGSLVGRLVGPVVSTTVSADGNATATVVLGAAHTLTVNVRDPSGAASPGKLTVLCAGGPCPFSVDDYLKHYLLDHPDFDAAAISYVPVNGVATVTLPPGEYDVLVSRGPEYSVWPDTWPMSAQRVDLRTADQTLDAVIGRIVDTPGWVSADLHVHAVASSDSAVGNTLRAANFIAEGVDVILSTDHEWITDFRPAVRQLGAEDVIGTMIGEEVTSFMYGHFNAFPLIQDTSKPNGGAFDHAGGEDGPTLRLPQLFAGIKDAHPGAVVQLNHPRGGGNSLNALKVDTATGRSHGTPEDFFMAPDPSATAMDTKVFGDNFDLIETANGPSPKYSILNDWMTFMSRGVVRVSSGVSDTHKPYSDNGGYARTYAAVGPSNDTPQTFSPQLYADAIRGKHAYATNSPILTFTAQRVDSTGTAVGPKVGMGDTLSINAGDRVEFTLDVQGLEWMGINRVELYSHAPGREAVDGVENTEWPEGRILQKFDIDPMTLPLEPVPGTSLRRLHITQKFTVMPTSDTWFVGMARGTTGRSMRPLHDSRPAAWTSAILIDADGSGAYDDFPLKPGQPLMAAPSPKPVRQRVVPTARQLNEIIVKLLEHKHD
ncbi:MAG: CehA/McbA family metallohydrolase [Archangium sp.]